MQSREEEALKEMWESGKRYAEGTGLDWGTRRYSESLKRAMKILHPRKSQVKTFHHVEEASA